MKSRKVLSVHLVFFVLMGGEVGPFTELIRCTACLAAKVVPCSAALLRRTWKRLSQIHPVASSICEPTLLNSPLYLTYAQVAPVMTIPHISRLQRLEIGDSIIKAQNCETM